MCAFLLDCQLALPRRQLSPQHAAAVGHQQGRAGPYLHRQVLCQAGGVWRMRGAAPAQGASWQQRAPAGWRCTRPGHPPAQPSCSGLPAWSAPALALPAGPRTGSWKAGGAGHSTVSLAARTGTVRAAEHEHPGQRTQQEGIALASTPTSGPRPVQEQRPGSALGTHLGVHLRAARVGQHSRHPIGRGLPARQVRAS